MAVLYCRIALCLDAWAEQLNYGRLYLTSCGLARQHAPLLRSLRGLKLVHVLLDPRSFSVVDGHQPPEQAVLSAQITQNAPAQDEIYNNPTNLYKLCNRYKPI
eukprot:scaffold350009_cov37-Prasinocladus_malaysianus.AAC.2